MGGHAFFPLFVDLEGRRVVVAGAGKVAARRVSRLAAFGAEIIVVAPEVHPEIERLAGEGAVKVVRRGCEASDFDGAALALIATDDAGLNAKLAAACRARGVPVNVASDRTLCDFHFPGIARKGNLVVGVHAGGEDHRGAKAAVEGLRAWLDGWDGEK